MSRMISFFVLLGIIVAIGAIFFQVMVGFLLPLFLAALLVVIFAPIHRWFLQRYPTRKHLAAALTTLTVMLIVLIPLTIVVTLAAAEASSLYRRLDGSLHDQLAELRADLDLEITHLDSLRYLESSLNRLVEDASLGASAKTDPATIDSILEGLVSFEAQLAGNADGAEPSVPAEADPTTDPPAVDDLDLEESAVEDSAVEDATVNEPVTEDPLEEGPAGSLRAVRRALRATKEPGKQPGKLGYRSQVEEAARQFSLFKTDLLKMEPAGGALIRGELRVKLKEWANPTQKQVDQWIAQLGVGAYLRSFGGAAGAATAQVAFGAVIMTISLYFFLVDGPAMTRTLMRLSPLDDNHERLLINEFDSVSRSVVLATLLSAAAQGLLAGLGLFVLGFWVDGLHDVTFLLMMLTMVLAIIPFVGATAVWLPTSCWLFFDDHRIAAVVLAIYGAGIISTADNIIKPLVLHGQSHLHPLLALLSVLGGVQALGPIGILVGPMAVVLLQTLLMILQREVMSLDEGTDPTTEGT